MSSKPHPLKVQFHIGDHLLLGSNIHAFVTDTLFEIGRSPEEAAALWTAATTDPGPAGATARHLIEQATSISITFVPPGPRLIFRAPRPPL